MDGIIVTGLCIAIILCLGGFFLDEDSTAYEIVNCINWNLTIALWILLLINIWFIK